MTVHHFPDKSAPKPTKPAVPDVKCPHCKADLVEGVNIHTWAIPPWFIICAQCPACHVGLSFFVLPATAEQSPIQMPS